MMQTKLILSLIASISFVDMMLSSQETGPELIGILQSSSSSSSSSLVARASSRKLFEADDSAYDLQDVFLSCYAMKIYLDLLKDFAETENYESCPRDSVDIDEDYFLVKEDVIKNDMQSQDLSSQQKLSTPCDVHTSLGSSYFDGEKEIA